MWLDKLWIIFDHTSTPADSIMKGLKDWSLASILMASSVKFQKEIDIKTTNWGIQVEWFLLLKSSIEEYWVAG